MGREWGIVGMKGGRVGYSGMKGGRVGYSGDERRESGV